MSDDQVTALLGMGKEVEKLIKAAGEADSPMAALQYSQGACNAANALETLYNTQWKIHTSAKSPKT